MLKYLVIISLVGLSVCCGLNSKSDIVSVNDRKVYVNESPYLIKGVCYHPVPLGSDERSFDNLLEDLELMKLAGINTIRVYSPITEQYVLDQIDSAEMKVIISFGYNQDGKHDILSGSFIDYVKKYKNHNAILFWELGNEYNYHPEWFDNDLSNWYTALNNAAHLIDRIDAFHPVATAHGDLPDSLALALCPNIDVWGMNVYRWDNPENVFSEWAAISDKAMYLAEAGADSYMSKTAHGYEQGHNEQAQADATKRILAETFAHQEICSGVTLFSFIDEWWKAGSNSTLDAGGFAPESSGVPYDGTANEEHWGIVDINRKPKEAYKAVAESFTSNL